MRLSPSPFNTGVCAPSPSQLLSSGDIFPVPPPRPVPEQHWGPALQPRPVFQLGELRPREAGCSGRAVWLRRLSILVLKVGIC